MRSERLTVLIRFFILLCGLALPVVLPAQSTWTAIPSGTKNTLLGVCYGNGQFVAVGENGTILTSPDGLAWTARDGHTTNRLVSVAYGANQYVTLSETTAAQSFDGVTWTAPTSLPLNRLNVVFFGDYYFGIYGEANHALVLDLPFHVGDRNQFSTPSPRSWRTVAAGRDLLVVGGDFGLGTFKRSDPVLRSPLAIEDQTGIRNVSGVVFEDSAFVAVGGGGRIVTSLDGKAWSAMPSPTTADLRAIASFNNTLLAVGDRGMVLEQEPDGQWQQRPPVTNNSLMSVAATAQAAVAVGSNGTILRSTPPATSPRITRQPSAATESLGGVVTFSVQAKGSLPLVYQWFHDGKALAEETRPDLVVPLIKVSDGGNYHVTVTNSAGAVASTPVPLSVLPAIASVVDESFQADLALEGVVRRLLPLPDGDILVVTNSTSSVEGPPICRLQKLHADGALARDWHEGTFTLEIPDIPNASPNVASVLLQSDSKILVGGQFTRHNGLPRNNLLRLNADGSLDPTFAPVSEAITRPIQALALQRDGKILVATSGSATPLRLATNGSLDPSFHPQPAPPANVPDTTDFKDWSVYAIAVTKEDNILLALEVSLTRSSSAMRVDSMVVQLKPDGTTDSSFTARRITNNLFQGLWATDDGAIVITADLLIPPFLINPLAHVRRFQADGTDYPNHLAPAISRLSATEVYLDGRVVYTAGGASLRLTRLGELDPTFTGGVGDGRTLAVAGDQVFVGGNFDLYNGKSAHRVARLNTVPNESRNAPKIDRLIADKTIVSVGELITVRASVSGSPDMMYFGSGGSSYTSPSPSPVFQVRFDSPGQGTFTVTARNPRGEAASATLYFTVLPAAPVIKIGDAKISAQQGRELTISAKVNFLAAGTCTITWYHNGQAVSTLLENDLQGTRLIYTATTNAQAGSYSLTARNAIGVSATSEPIIVTVDDTSRFANLSTRGIVSEAQSLIAGFVIPGNRWRNLLIRGAGPGLSRLGVRNVLPDPTISLFDSAGHLVTPRTNDNWQDGAGTESVPAATAKVGAFPFDVGSKDAAFLASLAPGNYTVQLAAKPGMTGDALIEIYEADNLAERMLNLSTRATMGGGTPVFTGFSISGPVSKRVLIRAAGPSLAGFGVANAHPDPRVTVRDAGGATLASNDQWGNYPERAALVDATKAAGAFPFAAGSKDAALLVTLPPGNYTAVLDSAESSIGIVLAEIYEVP